MYAIMGITGRVGGVAGEILLAKGHAVRAVVRSASKGSAWKQRGADVAVADSLDTQALARAFRDVEGVFVMVPPDFTPSKGFPETGAMIRSIRDALIDSKPPKLVALSSIGAQHDHGIGLINNSYMLESALAPLPMPVTFLRPGWFMENAAWDVQPARRHGSIDSFLQPTPRAVPMVATADVGRVAADLLLQDWSGRRVVELEGPRRTSPRDIATVLGRALGRDVVATPVPRERWASIFEAQGAAWPEPRIEMIEGFNSGRIEFEGEPLRGTITFEEVAMDLVSRDGGNH